MKQPFLTALGANEKGEIFEIEGYAALGMAGPVKLPIREKETVKVPLGTELMLLPLRSPVVMDLATGRFKTLRENPYEPGKPLFAVAAFSSPGYVNQFSPAYAEGRGADPLPLFAYGAVGWGNGGFRAPLIHVDKEPRQDLRYMDRDKVKKGIARMKKVLPNNRLRAHLEKCALVYGCPAGKNFFLARYEAPLPTSTRCNARCLGCISLQNHPKIKSPQNRIRFTPTPDEIADVALTHILKVENAVVSFGQGCEGDPLLAARSIGPAIEKIRAKTDKGTINLNTNASLPDVVGRLIGAGLDSMRVSMNSVRPVLYETYFRPRGYRFSDVAASIDLALEKGRFVSINYLNCPGFTDTPEEMEALSAFLKRHKIHMIQWRNLNFDPVRYVSIMNKAMACGRPLGMRAAISRVKKEHPRVIHGYFNPPRENMPEEFRH